MAKKDTQLLRIDNDRKLTKESDREFLCALQGGLLLALKEQVYLTDIQLRLAEEKLGWGKDP